MSSHMFQIESAAIEPKQSRDKSQDNISNECDQISVDPNSSRQSCQIGLARSAALDDKEQPGLAASSIPDYQNNLSLDLLSAQSKYYPKSSPENVNNKLQSTSPIPLSNHNWIRGEIVKNRPTSPYNVSSENSSTLLFGPMSELGTTVSKHNIEQDCSGDLTFPAQVTLDSDKQENNSKNRSVKTKRANSSSVVPYCFSYSLQSNTPIETRSNDSKNSGGKLSLTSKTDNILHSDTSYPNSLKSDSSYSKHNAEAHAKTLGLLPLQKSEDCSFNPSGKNKVREAKPNSKPVRRNSLANSAEYLRKLSLSAKHKTSTSMKKISEFIPFRKTVTISDEFASANQEKYKNGAVSLGNTPTIKRKQGVHIRPLEEELPASLPPSESEKKERRLPEKRVTNGKRNNASQRPKSHLQITDPDYVEYFQKYTSEKDKEFLRKYIHLKQGLESKLAQLELEYMNLLDLEPTEELELNLSTLESTQGDDLIFHCVNLFESHENPEKVLALSMHRDYENYIRSLQNCVFENVFKLINIKTLQNSINDRETEDKSDGNVETEEGKVKKIIPGKRKTQVFESDVFQSDDNVNFSTAQFLSPLRTGGVGMGRHGPCCHDIATSDLKEVSEEKLDPLMCKVSTLPPMSKRVSTTGICLDRARQMSVILADTSSHSSLLQHTGSSDSKLTTMCQNSKTSGSSVSNQSLTSGLNSQNNSRKQSAAMTAQQKHSTDLDLLNEIEFADSQ